MTGMGRNGSRSGACSLWAALIAAPAIVLLTACAGTPAEPEAGAPSEEATVTPTAPPADQGDPCARVGEILGDLFPSSSFGDPVATTGQHAIQDVEWTSSGCRWESAEYRVAVRMAGPGDFPGGFQCVEPLRSLDDVSALDGVADAAWWIWDDFQGGEGAVVACSGEQWTQVEIQGDRSGPLIDEAATQDAALAIYRAVAD